MLQSTDDMEHSQKQGLSLIMVLLIVACVGVVGLGVLFLLQKEHMAAVSADLEAANASAQERIAVLEQTLEETAQQLQDTLDRNERLEEELEEEEERNEEFAEQIEKITGTVGQLDKLSKTDRELLQKYSKVYFLNENYIPEKVVKIEDQYVYNESSTKYIHAQVEEYLYDMIDDANDDDIELWVISAYRSFDEQTALKGQYTTTYGSGANAFSADQGYSEHQLGTTVDFTTTGLNGGLAGFGNTEAFAWLEENAHKYGFVLSYPEGNAFYVYEPWHWRFVGTELADDLHDDGKHFYDLDQREIDEYLISIFD